MRQIPSEFASHLAGQCTTLCRCWKIIRRDTLVLGFTEHDRLLNFAETTFLPMSGMDTSVGETSLGLNSDGVEVLGALTSQALSAQDIRADKYDGARVEVYQVNWTTPAEYIMENTYQVAEIIEEDGLFKAELHTLENQLDQTRGEHFIAQCQANLGDIRCGVDVETASFKGTGVVVSYDGERSLEVTGLLNFSNGWFDAGVLRWTTGSNDKTTSLVTTHNVKNGTVKLEIWKTLPGEIAAGDSFEITAGCDKNFSTCKSKFANALNFRGFPHLPGSDFARSYASISSKMDGGIIVE